MARAAVNEQFPQREIDLMFWHYMSGVVDAVMTDGVYLIPAKEEALVNLRQRKIASIIEVYGKPPTFNVAVELAYKDGECYLNLVKIDI